MKVTAIVQARMGSSRLPGKVMRILGDRTVLGHVIARVRRIAGVDEVVVATTDHAADDAIESESRRHGATVYRGSETDVLDRYQRAAASSGADVVVRITSDCPLLDPELVSKMLEEFLARVGSADQLDYMSNGLRRTFPRGLDAEIFLSQVLERAHREARRPYEREHVTPYVYEHPEQFRIYSYEGSVDLSHLRWTLDTDSDLEMLEKIFAGLRHLPSPATADVFAYLDHHPEVARINAEVRQKVLGQ